MLTEQVKMKKKDNDKIKKVGPNVERLWLSQFQPMTKQFIRP